MNLNKFGFTANTDQIAFKKVIGFKKIEEVLNKYLTITNYTQNLQKIVFVYIAITPELNFKEEDFKRYRWKNKCLEVGLNLNYKRLLQAKEPEVLQILAEGYLRGIEELMQRKDFDNKRFYKDVEKLFIENGLLPQAVVA